MLLCTPRQQLTLLQILAAHRTLSTAAPLIIAASRQIWTVSESRQSSIQRIKFPNRGGKNLSERYVRLEKSLRGKEAYLMGSQNTSQTPSSPTNVVRSKTKPKILFHGFVVPEEPKPPAGDECCMSGCAVCVYDLHEEALESYKEAVMSLRTSLSALGIPEQQWPAAIQARKSSINGASEKRKEVIMDAFEEMERALAAKHNTGGNTISLQNTQRPASKRPRTPLKVMAKELYDGIGWVLFSNR